MNEKISAMYSEMKDLACKLAGMTEDEMLRYLRRKERGDEGDVRFRTSEELNSEYGSRWIDEQTNEDGRHTTQVKNTINSYKKFGDWVKKDSDGRHVDVLDASSGLGLGTQWMRENGMTVDDVEPFPSKDREKPTFESYDAIDKKYDYIISNAVLNVIPDDWRTNVLHDMGSKLKDGGKLVINVRGAQSIKTQGKEGKTRITLDDPSEIFVLRPDGSIKAYQKGFTKDELKNWCEEDLGNGYTVEIANSKNAGGSYDTAVVVKKNNEEGTNGSALRASHPDRSAQAVANSNAKLQKLSEYRKNLSTVKEDLDNNGEYGASEFLHNLALIFGRNNDNGLSQYVNIGNNVSLRIASHYANAENYNNTSSKKDENYGIVIKLSPTRFKKKNDVNYLEYVYSPDKLGRERQNEIVDGLLDFLSKGDFSGLPRPDKIHVSGEFVDYYKEKGIDVDNSGEVRFRKGETLADRRRRNAAARGGQAKPQQPRTNGGVGNAAARGGETKGETPQEEAVQARLTTAAVETAAHEEGARTAEVGAVEEMTSREMTSREMMPREMTPREMTPREMTPREMTPREMTPREMTSREMTPREREEKVVRERRYPVVEKAVKELNTDVTTHDSVDSIENAAVRRIETIFFPPQKQYLYEALLYCFQVISNMVMI